MRPKRARHFLPKLAVLAALVYVLVWGVGCGRKASCPVDADTPAPPKPLDASKPAAGLPSADEKALQQLGQQIFAAFASGDAAQFHSLTVAGLSALEQATALRTVREKESRQIIAQLEAVPVDQRNALQLDALRLAKAFIANPKEAFADEWPGTEKLIAALGKGQLEFFYLHTSPDAPLDWAKAGKPSMVISINPQVDLILPEARVNIVFSADGKSYRLQLSNCAKLSGHGWLVAEALRFIDLSAEAAAEKDWGTDLAAAVKQAKAESKHVLLDFTGLDWCPNCIALHDRVLTQPVFRDWAAQKLVLVRADFPRHTSPPKAQADANKRLVHQYAVNGFPTLLLLDANGKELHRIEGYNNEDAATWVGALKKKLNSDGE